VVHHVALQEPSVILPLQRALHPALLSQPHAELLVVPVTKSAWILNALQIVTQLSCLAGHSVVEQPHSATGPHYNALPTALYQEHVELTVVECNKFATERLRLASRTKIQTAQTIGLLATLQRHGV
jgi:hypothetical protein